MRVNIKEKGIKSIYFSMMDFRENQPIKQPIYQIFQ